MANRLEELEERIQALEERLDVMEGKAVSRTTEEPKVAPVVEEPVVEPLVQETSIPKVERRMPAPPPMISPVSINSMQPAQASPIPSTSIPTAKTQTPTPAPEFYEREPEHRAGGNSTIAKDGWESFIGKNLMGILASVLVFIGLILFSVLLLPYLTETIKIIAMYAFSFGLTGISLYALRKKENVLLLSLSGCGVGAVFISLFVSHLYFGVINMVWLYVLLALWAIGTFYLSRRFSWVFHVIGEAGVFISCILGMHYIQSMHMDSMLIGMMIFFVVGSVTFLFPVANHSMDRLVSNIFHLVNVTTMCMMLALFYDFHRWELKQALSLDMNLLIPFVIMVCYLAALIAYHMYRIVVEPTELEYLFGLAYFGNLLWMVYAFYESGIGLSVLCMILGICFYGLFSMLPPKKDFNMYIVWRVAMAVLTICGVLGFGFEMDNIATVVVHALIAALFIGWGFYRKDTMTGTIGMIFYGIGILVSAVAGNLIYGDLEIIQDWVYLVLWVALSLEIYLWMKRQRDCYRTGYKMITHIGLTVVLIYGMVQIDQLDWIWTILLQWMVVAGYNVLVMKTAFARHWVTGAQEKPFTILTQILNGIWIIEGLILMSSLDQTAITQIITIIVMVALCSLNTLRQLQYGSKSAGTSYAPDLYVCGKYVALLAYILFRLRAADYVADIIILLFAIGCIIVGFVAMKKGMRIFGLALSLLAMVKLILIDIHYDHSAGRAASFLLCGVLCFSISAIYTYVDKRLKQAKTETGD